MSSAQGGEDGGSPPGGTIAAGHPPLLAAAFAAGGEMGERLARFDWSASPLGAPAGWSSALCHAVGMMLTSRAQIAMFWGDDHLAFYNDACRPTVGAKHPAVIGQPARAHWADTWDVLGPLVDRVRRTGDPYRGADQQFVLDRHGFVEDVYFDVSYDPIRNLDGSINGVFCLVNETTGRVLGERRLRALAELGDELAGVRSIDELVRTAATVLDGHRADVPFGLIYLRDDVGRHSLAGCGGVDPAMAADEPPAVLARVARGDPAATVDVAELLGSVPDDAAGQALVLPIIPTHEPAGALVVGVGRRLPLTDEYRTFIDLVAIQISRAAARQQAYERERARAAELATNAQLQAAEHRIATTLQHSLLPRTLPQPPDAVVAGRYLPGSADGEVGGDWYDVIGVDDDELVLVVGDVAGKGVRAVAAMGQLRNALRAYVLAGFDPGQSLTRVNLLVGSGERSAFATLVCLWFHPRTGRLRYASAGHPSPLLIRGDDVTFLHARALGPPVGAVPDTAYRTVEGQLAPGGRLLLYTDGLIGDRQLGIDAALAQVRADATARGERVAELVDAVVERVAARPRHDDVAVLALEAAEPNRLALRLPADPTRLSVLRKRLERFLIAHQVGESDLIDLTVAVSEAAANAIEHPVQPAEPVIDVEVAIEDRTVVATVRDSGRWREPTGSGFRGRGLALIKALGEASVRRTADGTEVTLRRRLQD